MSTASPTTFSPETNDTGRLPPYRQGHGLRFHPYTRAGPRSVERMVQTIVSCVYGDENPVVAQPSPLSVIEEVNEEDLMNLERALPIEPQPYKLRRRLSALVISPAFAIRRHCSGLRSSRKRASAENMNLPA